MKKIGCGINHKTPKVPTGSHRSGKTGGAMAHHTHGQSSKKKK